MKKKSISVIISAYNEENYLAKAVHEINDVVKRIFFDYELLIFDDGGSDKTGEIADDLARKNFKIRVIHNKRNSGVGYNYREGVRLAQKGYVTALPGDGGIPKDAIRSVLRHTGDAEIIIAFTANKEARPFFRRIASYCFTNILNILFGLHLKYYNGIVVYKTELVRTIKMTTNSFAFQAEILVKLLKRGYSYKEVPMYIQEQKGKLNNIFKIKNLMGVAQTLTRLFFEMHFKRKKSLKKSKKKIKCLY